MWPEPSQPGVGHWMRSRARWDWDRRECVSGERGGLEQGDLGERKKVSSLYGGDEEEEDGPFVVLCKKKIKKNHQNSTFIQHVHGICHKVTLPRHHQSGQDQTFTAGIILLRNITEAGQIKCLPISPETTTLNTQKLNTNFKHRKITQPTQTQN